MFQQRGRQSKGRGAGGSLGGRQNRQRFRTAAVCVRMCVPAYVHVRACACVCVHMRAFMRVPECLHVCAVHAHVFLCACVCVRAHLCARQCVHVRVHACICVHACVYVMHVQVYTWVWVGESPDLSAWPTLSPLSVSKLPKRLLVLGRAARYLGAFLCPPGLGCVPSFVHCAPQPSQLPAVRLKWKPGLKTPQKAKTIYATLANQNLAYFMNASKN